MHPLLLFIKMSLITTKIIYIYSSDADISEATLNRKERIKFGEEVWRCIIRQAVQKMTEQENFLPIIQGIWIVGKIDERDIGPFARHVITVIEDFISAELNVEKSHITRTQNYNIESLEYLITVSTVLSIEENIIIAAMRLLNGIH